MKGFKQISPDELKDNLFRLIAKDWTLITAGKKDNYNMMTANWLGMGFLWMKNVCFLFIRPSRYTYEFTEKYPTLSLNFFSESYRDVLNYCGKESGRNVNKMKECALSPIELSGGGVAFEESRIILNCKKMCVGDIESFNFIDADVLKNYADQDWHKLYICEITEAFIKE